MASKNTNGAKRIRMMDLYNRAGNILREADAKIQHGGTVSTKVGQTKTMTVCPECGAHFATTYGD